MEFRINSRHQTTNYNTITTNLNILFVSGVTKGSKLHMCLGQFDHYQGSQMPRDLISKELL